MAGEYRRIRGRKKIVFATGDDMYIPVLTGISLVDPRDRYQEWQYAIDNSDKADRDIHVDDVYPVAVDADGKPVDEVPIKDTSVEPLKVERIDNWKILDARSRYQEHNVEFDNKTGADLIPPSFTTHQTTHIYRYYKDPENPDDDGIWIDSELIDNLAHVDPRSRYQETVATFNNPTNTEFRDGDLSGQASSDDPDVTIGDGEGTEENPVRLDPFQNIVNFNCRPLGTFVVFERWYAGDEIQGYYNHTFLIHSSSDGLSWQTFDTGCMGGNSPSQADVLSAIYANGMFLVGARYHQGTFSVGGYQDRVFASTDFFNWSNVWNSQMNAYGIPIEDSDFVQGNFSYNSTTNEFSIPHGYPTAITYAIIANPISIDAKYSKTYPSGLRAPSGITWFGPGNYAGFPYPPGFTGTFDDNGFYIGRRDDSGTGYMTEIIFPQDAASNLGGYYLQIPGGSSTFPPADQPPIP